MNSYEKSVFLTKGQEEIVKNYFTAQSKGNMLGQGFDDSLKRQTDLSMLVTVDECSLVEGMDDYKIDGRGSVWKVPVETFVLLNEVITTTDHSLLQLLPLRYDEYTRLMQKPYKRPLKNQAWKLQVNAVSSNDKYVEIIPNTGVQIDTYKIRYVKHPSPIILEDLEDGYSINGQVTAQTCKLDPNIHDDILTRAAELAKIAWLNTGADALQTVLTAGTRSE